MTLYRLVLVSLVILSLVGALERSGDTLGEVEARLLSLVPGNPGHADVLLQWTAFNNESATGDNDVSSLSTSDPVVEYTIESTVSGADTWLKVADGVSGMTESAATGPRVDRHEKQRIVTRVDAGQTITDGFFRLAISHAQTSPLDMHQHTVTPPIAFDASESDVKHALETLDVISSVQVFRQVLDATAGTFEWIVLFDPPPSSHGADHGDLPLLTLYAETISASYSNTGDQVAIEGVRDGIVDGLTCLDDCAFTVRGLQVGQTLAFRVRARFAIRGWSRWSRASEPLEIPPTPVPRAPPAPELLSTTSSRLTIRWTTRGRDLFPVTSFHLQQKCDRDLSWRSVDTAIPPGRTGTTVASSSSTLQPNTICVFRIAATNANGGGPFSAPSAPFQTLAAVPTAPQHVHMCRLPLLGLVWQPPVNDGGSPIVSYEVELRTFASSTWTRVPSTSINVTERSCDLTTMALAPYTRYVARVRARNAIGTSAFVEVTDLLTDYQVPVNKSLPMDASIAPGTVVTLAATRSQAANINDLQYIHGIAYGGQQQGQDGEPGVVLVFPITFAGERLDEQAFYYTGSIQTFRVPQDNTPYHQIVALDVYAWGGGGGSGDKVAWGTGGGGAFARSVVRVGAGDTIQILVGGGGQGAVRGGRGGWNGGGNGGIGGFTGGGGGGASGVRVNNKIVLMAAGGGGGGSSDYCCAHGGGGGGVTAAAEDGLFPDASSIPLDSRITGVIRNEYHSINVQGDVRDMVGLPARHNNLEYGYAAASADYSILATGGSGAFGARGGTAGQAGSYVVSRSGKCFVNADSGSLFVGDALAASQATPGRRGRGGKGQDGADSGGGGGGGYVGGGGGGAGVDGAGGGGGSSFVAMEVLFTKTTFSTISPESVTNFTAIATTSTSVILTWQDPPFGYRQPLQGIIVEMANRSVNENFRVKNVLPATATTVVLNGLQPAWWYRFRVKTLFRDAAHGIYSDIRTIQTLPTPVNTWQRVRGVRFIDERTTHGGIRVVDALPRRRLPSARRGHSLTAFDDGFIYLFGGFSGGYPCNPAHKAVCVVNTGVTNELWRFDTHTRFWLELATLGGPPVAREKHSMAVISSHLLLFGGRQGGAYDAAAVLNDLWSLKITSTTRKTIVSLQNKETNLAIGDGSETFTIANVGAPPDMCVADMMVTIDVTHGCAQSLRIELLGPGPSTDPQRQQSPTSTVDSQTFETTWSDLSGFGTGQKRTTSTTPSTRSFPVTLQRPEMASSGSTCLAGRRTLTFGLSSSKGLESLAVFRQLSASGGWTLSVLDTRLDGNTGTLNTWDITFTLVPCVPTWTWTNVGASATGATPSARYQHSVIVYQSSMFVFGGRSATGAMLNDLYRLDYNALGDTGVWTTLMPVTAAPDKVFYYGRMVVVTPYQLLAIGRGLRSRATTIESHALTSGEYVARKSVTEILGPWQPLVVDATTEDTELVMPQSRYWSSAVFMADPTPRVYLYGGQDDTTLMSDFWMLQLDALVELEPSVDVETRRQAICTWRLANTVFQQKWTTSCGASAASVVAGTATECSLDVVLLYAWCTKNYQTVHL